MCTTLLNIHSYSFSEIELTLSWITSTIGPFSIMTTVCIIIAHHCFSLLSALFYCESFLCSFLVIQIHKAGFPEDVKVINWLQDPHPTPTALPLSPLSRPLCQKRGWPRHPTRTCRLKSSKSRVCRSLVQALDQLPVGFVWTEGSQVKTLPKDVEGDATFGLAPIHLLPLSSTPNISLMLSSEADAAFCKLHVFSCRSDTSTSDFLFAWHCQISPHARGKHQSKYIFVVTEGMQMR